MKTVQNFGLFYILFVVAQMFICNYFNFSMYVTLSILPVLVMYIPLSVNTILTMLIAFCTGLATDALSDAVLGLNALALTPVALLRKPIIRMVMGEETIERQETLNVRKNGFLSISLAIVLSCFIFIAIYIIADGAGTRPLWFNVARFFASVASSYLLSLIIVKALTPEK